MKEAKLIILAFVIVIIVTVGAALTFMAYEDNYCMNVPLDRMDKKRCGLGQ